MCVTNASRQLCLMSHSTGRVSIYWVIAASPCCSWMCVTWSDAWLYNMKETNRYFTISTYMYTSSYTAYAHEQCQTEPMDTNCVRTMLVKLTWATRPKPVQTCMNSKSAEWQRRGVMAHILLRGLFGFRFLPVFSILGHSVIHYHQCLSVFRTRPCMGVLHDQMVWDQFFRSPEDPMSTPTAQANMRSMMVSKM